MLIIIVTAIPVGIISAVRRNSWLDNITMGGTLLAQSMPTFWVGTMLILIFGVYLRWLPISGRDGPTSIILPAITLAAFGAARNARVTRSSMLDALSQDYVRTGAARGWASAPSSCGTLSRTR